MPPDQPHSRKTDRTVHYTMKTSTRPGSTPVQSSSTPGFRSGKTSTTPTLQSPYFPYSVGQQYPPKLSPSAANSRLATPQLSHDSSQARTPSPNYFGLVVEPTPDPRDTSMLPRENWSPVTSSIKSFVAAIPKQLPLDANPEFEAFRRQADANRGASGFSLATSHLGVGGAWSSSSTDSAGPNAFPARRPRVPRWHTHGSNPAAGTPASMRPPDTAVAPDVASLQEQPPSLPQLALHRGLLDRGGQQHPASSHMDVDTDDAGGSHHTAGAPTKSTREPATAETDPQFFWGTPQPEGSAQARENIQDGVSQPNAKDGHARFDMAANCGRPNIEINSRKAPKPAAVPVSASATEPGAPTMLSPSELKEMLQTSAPEDVLLLDLRVSTLYQTSRIQGALNLCIPTTLLKRATFDLQKLQQTFQTDEHQDKFAHWQATKCLVVYDAHSTDKRDATSCINMLKKFTHAGYKGRAYILSGGFNAFAGLYPDLVDRRRGGERAGKPTLSLKHEKESGRPAVAPVIGGVMLPTGSDAAPNPFFSNIRQNMDLADGVGQMDIAVPPGVNPKALPKWLSQVADKADHGKHVSEQFLAIEKKEQARMRRAYTAYKSNTSSLTPGSATVEISGIEKGDKNRYNNIFPFEHSRVRLAVRQEGESDYINASHIKATRSHKRYIASQGPLPATFEDFWSMIWDQDVRVIVMLTAEHEGGHLKCHPYWREKEFGPLKLRSLSEKKVSLDIDKRRPTDKSSARPSQNPSTPGPQSTQPQTAGEGRRRANTAANPFRPETDGFFKNPPAAQSPQEAPIVVVRKFALSHAAHPFAPIREITHLHYSSWPDFGAPAQPSHLLALVELANLMQHAAYPVDVNSTIATSERAVSAAKLSPQNSIGNSSSSAEAFGSVARNMGGREYVPEAWQEQPLNDSKSRPMLVHCSAGCGRTGTFCTVDSVLDMLKRQRQRGKRRARAAAAASEKRVRREGVKRKLEQRDPEGDVAMFGISGASRDRALRRDSDGGSPSRASFTDSPVFSSPPKFPFPNVADTRDSRGNSLSGSDDSVSFSYCSSSDEHQPPFSPITGSSALVGGGGGGGGSLDTSWLEDDSIDLIASTVEDFRGQRLSMVQTIRQFVLCYETVLEWVARLQERTGDDEASLLSSGSASTSRARMRSGSLQAAQRRNS